MKIQVIGLFPHATNATDAVRKIKSGNLTEDISVVAKDKDQSYVNTEMNKVKESGNEIAGGTVTGSLLGALIGLFVGATAVAVPGGVIVFGKLATTLIGVGGGATLGALAGAIAKDGAMDKYKVNMLINKIENGEILIVTQTDDKSNVEKIRNIMIDNEAELIEEIE